MGVSTPFAPISATVLLCKNLERKRLGHSRPNSSHRRSGARRIQVNSGTSISGHGKGGHWVPAVLSRRSACDDLQVERIEGGQRGGRRTTRRSGCRRRGPRRNRASRGSSGRGPRGAGALAAVTVDDLAHDAVTTAAQHVARSRAGRAVRGGHGAAGSPSECRPMRERTPQSPLQVRCPLGALVPKVTAIKDAEPVPTSFPPHPGQRQNLQPRDLLSRVHRPAPALPHGRTPATPVRSRPTHTAPCSASTPAHGPTVRPAP